MSFQTDDEIARRIDDELWWSPFVSGSDIDVAVEHGVVTLTGTVRSATARRAAIENCFDAGAAWVHDELEIGSAPTGAAHGGDQR